MVRDIPPKSLQSTGLLGNTSGRHLWKRLVVPVLWNTAPDMKFIHVCKRHLPTDDLVSELPTGGLLQVLPLAELGGRPLAECVPSETLQSDG